MTEANTFKGCPVLVTGAAGCIGAWTVKLLSELGAVPVVFDLTENRHRLKLIMDDAQSVTWELGDITDFDRLQVVAEKHNIEAIIHLAALQVPFCKADPVDSTKINVLGSTHILELARQRGISRLSYASSIAAQAMDDNKWLTTLYGAHKVCTEQMAAVYWQDWGLPSVGIRPAIIYGPGRDQGMSSAPTIAMLAASVGKAYEIPFSGAVSYVHVEDAALRFIGAIAKSYEGAHVFDLDGTPANIEEVISLIRSHHSEANISYTGDAMPFPADTDNGKLNQLLEISGCRPMTQGVRDTMAVFAQARERGIDLNQLLNETIRRNS
jgi:nucleoside-diphosphate-sugar epimerase